MPQPILLVYVVRGLMLVMVPHPAKVCRKRAIRTKTPHFLCSREEYIMSLFTFAHGSKLLQQDLSKSQVLHIRYVENLVRVGV